MLLRLACGSKAERVIWLSRSLSRESNREATTCGFCFSANCTASFSVRGIVRGGPGADWASPPSQKTANNDSRQTIDAIRHGGASAFVLVLMLSTISTQRYLHAGVQRCGSPIRSHFFAIVRGMQEGYVHQATLRRQTDPCRRTELPLLARLRSNTKQCDIVVGSRYPSAFPRKLVSRTSLRRHRWRANNTFDPEENPTLRPNRRLTNSFQCCSSKTVAQIMIGMLRAFHWQRKAGLRLNLAEVLPSWRWR
jgi:hypothetical protein